MVKVYLVKQDLKEAMNKHPRGRDIYKHPSGYKFNREGVSDWPMDKWTRARIAEGAISLEPPAEQAAQTKQSPQQIEQRRTRRSSAPSSE